MELFKLEAGASIVHVPYKGLAGALTDLMGGHVQVMLTNLQTVHPYVTGGRMRMLAVASAQRLPAFPQVPTLMEQGLALEVETWSGALVPAATPAALIARLNADINAVLDHTDIREQLARQGMSAAGGPPERFRALLISELARWSRVVEAAKIKID